ncbi:MAG: hypothetical protein P1V20_14830 [Verrucomicrobiales bacterium]|nr:hypothetical protein [Verrucomicrobiales bacterium]
MKVPLHLILLFATILVTTAPNSATAYETPEDLYRYLATVERVIDGNTLSANVDLGFGVWRHKAEIRLKGVKIPTVEEDSEKAVAAHRFLHTTLNDQERILIQTYYDPTGKYDGWYGEVSIWDEDKEDWISVNQIVIDAGHGTAIE